MKMKGWAYSLLHLSPDSFGRLTIPEFWAAMESHAEEKAADRKHIAELVRGATMRLWNLQVDAKFKCDDPAKFWEMPYDEKEPVTNMNDLSQEERDRMAREFVNSLKKDGCI